MGNIFSLSTSEERFPANPTFSCRLSPTNPAHSLQLLFVTIYKKLATEVMSTRMTTAKV